MTERERAESARGSASAHAHKPPGGWSWWQFRALCSSSMHVARGSFVVIE